MCDDGRRGDESEGCGRREGEREEGGPDEREGHKKRVGEEAGEGGGEARRGPEGFLRLASLLL